MWCGGEVEARAGCGLRVVWKLFEGGWFWNGFGLICWRFGVDLGGDLKCENDYDPEQP